MPGLMAPPRDLTDFPIVVFQELDQHQDWISFDEVAASGTYELVLYYAARDAGGKFEVSFKGSKLPFELLEAHDVPELALRMTVT